MGRVNKEIGAALQKARVNAGYRSARSFAKAFNIPESTYSQHETGERSLVPEVMWEYCRCLNISPSEIIACIPAEWVARKIECPAQQSLPRRGEQILVERTLLRECLYAVLTSYFCDSISDSRMSQIMSTFYQTLTWKNRMSPWLLDHTDR